VFESVAALANGRHGLSVNGKLERVFDSEFAYNQASGLYLDGVGAVRVEGNSIYDNRGTGLYIRQTGGGGETPTVGHANLTLGRGNRIENNGGLGIDSRGSAVIVGNTVCGQTSATGIKLDFGTVQQNVVCDNAVGIEGSAAVIGNQGVPQREYRNRCGKRSAHGSRQRSLLQRNRRRLALR
jgi:parallel beta-helix repeat protein